jgi:hypothetical protein
MKWPTIGKGKGPDDQTAKTHAVPIEETAGKEEVNVSGPPKQAGDANSDEGTTGAEQTQLRAFAPAIAEEMTGSDTAAEEPEEDIFDTTMRYAEQDREAEEESAKGETAPDDVPEVKTADQKSADSKGSPKTGSEEDIDDEFVEEIVREINTKNAKMDSGREEIGALLYDLVFGGDMELVLSKNPNKSNSFQKITNHRDCNISAKTASSYVRAEGFKRHLVSLGKDISNLTFSHLIELVSVEAADRRLELAEEINRNPVSVQMTRKRVTEVNAEKAPDKTLKRIFRRMKDPLSLPGGEEFKKLVSDDKKLEKDLSVTEREELLKHITKKKGHIGDCVVLLDKLQEALQIIDA